MFPPPRPLVHNVVGKDKQFKPLSNNAMRSRLNDWTAKYNMQKCSEFSLFNLNAKCHSVGPYCISNMPQCFLRAARRLPLLSIDRWAKFKLSLSLSLTKAVNSILTHNVTAESWQKGRSSDFLCFIKSTLKQWHSSTCDLNWFLGKPSVTSETVTEQQLHQGHTVWLSFVIIWTDTLMFPWAH